MGVPIIENWSEITGTVLDTGMPCDTQGFIEVEIQVERSEAVEGYPNLLAAAAGKPLTVMMPEELVREKKIAGGEKITCRVRKAGLNKVFVHREHLQIVP